MRDFITNWATRLGALVCLLSCGLLSSAAENYTPGLPIKKDFAAFAKPFLVKHCVDCHGGEDPAGKLSLHDLGPVDEINAATWKAIWAQVTLQEMPPKDADQPAIVQRLQFSDWVVGELTRAMRDKGGFRFEDSLGALFITTKVVTGVRTCEKQDLIG